MAKQLKELTDMKPPKVTPRFCRMCKKLLPADRYFNHKECVDHLDDYPLFAVSQYEIYNGR